MKRGFLKFFSPDGGESGGSAAVAEPMKAVGADAAGPLESPSVIYARTMKKLSGKEDGARPPAAAPAVEPAKPAASPAKQEPAKEEPKPEAAKEPVKPASALDAAFEESTDEGEKAPALAEDYLKDLPETLPKDKGSEHWIKARGAISKLSESLSAKEKAIAELQTQLQSAGTPSAEIMAENEALKKENAEQKEALISLNIEFEPNYREKFVTGRKALVDKAAGKLTAFGGKGELLVEALEMPEGRARTTAIKEAIADLEDVERSRVLQFVGDVERLDDEKDALKKGDAAEAWEKLKATDTKKQQAAKEEAENYKKKVYEDTKDAIPKRLLLSRRVDPTLDGAKEHNELAEKIDQEAWRLIGTGVTPQELTEKAFWAAAGPHLQTHLVRTRKELRELSARLAEYEGAEPGFRGGKPKEKSSIEQKLEKTPGQLYAEKMKELQSGYGE